MITDGTANMTLGGVVGGGFGVDAVKLFMGSGPTMGWPSVLASGVGLASVVFGLWLRRRSRRRMRVGVVVSAMDARRGLMRARQLEQQAEAFSRGACMVTLKAGVELSDGGGWNQALVGALADETLSAMTLAERLTPDAGQINLIPTMPLNVAFWFGSRLGYTHAREVVVHALRQANGTPAYFPATSLRAMDADVEPLTVERLRAIDGGDPRAVALALDLQGHGDQFFDQVTAACRQHNIGYLLSIQSPADLPENRITSVGVVEQTFRAWRDAPFPVGARAGRHAIFLNGPVAIAVALGARLASPGHGTWTAFTFDEASNLFEPFPPVLPD